MISVFMVLWRDGWVGRLLACLVSMVAAFLLLIVAWGLFVAVDSWFLPDREAYAEVCGRNYSPAWIQTIYHTDGKGGGWTQIIYHPENWSVRMRVNRLSDSVTVSRHTYDSVPNGEQVRVLYRIGRLSDDLYITEAFFNP